MRLKNLKNRRLKELIYSILRVLLDLSTRILKSLSLRSVYKLADGTGDMFYRFNCGYRHRVLNHLRLTLSGEKSEGDIRDIARESIRNLIRFSLEVTYLSISSPNGISDRITLEGEKYLNQALAKGKGVIGLGAHFGNFMIMGAKLVSEGYAFNIIVKDPIEDWYPGWGQTLRDKIGYKTIPLRPRELCAKRILRALGNNEIVYMVADDNKLSGGVFVDFFGKKAATAKGPATLSLKTGAPILPIFIIRQPNNTHKIVIDPPLEIDRSLNHSKDVFMITQAFTKVIEDYVRNYPDHWSWGRQRWKTQPKELGAKS